MRGDLISEGPFKGWYTWKNEPFEHDTAGPFYFRIDEEGPVAAFRAEERHMNAGGVMHGGCLMTFADFSLFALAHNEANPTSYGATVAFTCEFLYGATVGQYIEARGDILREGRSLTFVRGVITADDTPVLNFSGTLKLKRETA